MGLEIACDHNDIKSVFKPVSQLPAILALVVLLTATAAVAQTLLPPGGAILTPPPPPAPPPPSMAIPVVPRLDAMPTQPNVPARRSFGDRITDCLADGAAAGLDSGNRAAYSRACANR